MLTSWGRAMKLIVQIPCLNEAETLPRTIPQIPRRLEGVDRIELLVIDDGSTDGTADVARSLGVDHVVRNRGRRGLARTFMVGLDEALRLGADIVVNIDGDNQYPGEMIGALIQPILAGTADMVIGDRQVTRVAHFSAPKKFLQRVGSAIVRRLSGTDVRDAASGFRALSREAALRLVVVSPHTYTLETIIQAGREGMPIANVPIGTNPPLRESRLIASIAGYVAYSGATALRTFAMYAPLRIFISVGALFGLAGLALCVRFLYFFFYYGQGQGHVQSLILAAILLLVGFHFFMVGVLADLVRFNRLLLGELLYRARR
jgi:glycosyltransferase involved in cell wall biosynthesis